MSKKFGKDTSKPKTGWIATNIPSSLDTYMTGRAKEAKKEQKQKGKKGNENFQEFSNKKASKASVPDSLNDMMKKIIASNN